MSELDIPRDFNAAAYFIDRHMKEGRADKIAIESESGEITYARLLDNVNRAGNALLRLGLRREERVALILLDCPEFFYAFFGAIKIGAVPVPLNTLLRPENYLYLLNDCRARILVVSAPLWPSIEALGRGRLPHLDQVISTGDGSSVETLARLMTESPGELEPEPTSKDDAAFWLYSSGSTGAPKGCVHLHHDMLVAADGYAKRTLGMQERDRCFSVAKLFFAYGLGNAGYFPLACGATTTLWPGSTHPANVFAAIARHRPTLFFSVPSNFSALLQYAEANDEKFDLSSIRWEVSAGEPLPAAIYHRFRERFQVEILDAIGSTEALHMFIANRPGAVRPGSSGQIIEGYEARIIGDDDQPVATGEVGDLYIKSDAVCERYWNQHEKTKDVLRGHWLKTGDKYSKDQDGFFWYAGRGDDMLKVSGMWVSPAEVESVLIEHPAVLEAAVVARKDGHGLLRPGAVVVLRGQASASPKLAEELTEFVASRLAVYKRPRWVEFQAELPKTATGKIQRFKLREQPAEPSTEPA